MNCRVHRARLHARRSTDLDVASEAVRHFPMSRAFAAWPPHLLSSEHDVKSVSRNSAFLEKLAIQSDAGDSPAQTGGSRNKCEGQRSLWENSLSLSPGQLAQLDSQRRQGRRLFLPWLAEGFEPSDDLCCTMQTAMQINCLVQGALIAPTHPAWGRTLSTISVFGASSDALVRQTL